MDLIYQQLHEQSLQQMSDVEGGDVVGCVFDMKEIGEQDVHGEEEEVGSIVHLSSQSRLVGGLARLRMNCYHSCNLHGGLQEALSNHNQYHLCNSGHYQKCEN